MTRFKLENMKQEPLEEEEQISSPANGHFLCDAVEDKSSEDTPYSKPPAPRNPCPCSNCDSKTTVLSEKRHNCYICDGLFKKTSHLRAHLLRHEGLKPFECSCGKRFTRSDELRRHTRTHTGDKQYLCIECDKRFMRSDHLRKHVLTHRKAAKSEVKNVPKISKGRSVPDYVDINPEVIIKTEVGEEF